MITNALSELPMFLREHPFNLKGGIWFFVEKKILSANLMGKEFLSTTWAEKNILLSLFALKNTVFVEKK